MNLKYLSHPLANAGMQTSCHHHAVPALGWSIFEGNRIGGGVMSVLYWALWNDARQDQPAFAFGTTP
jgi:hypothetical protein